MKKRWMRASAVFFLVIGVIPLSLVGPWCRYARRSKPSDKPTRLGPHKEPADERDRPER